MVTDAFLDSGRFARTMGLPLKALVVFAGLARGD
jgi:hypothetical protein